jgi:hypothetical protein
MDSLTFRANDSFGIGSMIHTFSFNEGNNENCLAIYAPNGSCKSSLRKSLECWSRGERPKDVFFPARNDKAFFELLTQPEGAIPETNVFCFKSMTEVEGLRYFEDDLLASPELKEQYVGFIQSHREQKENLLSALHDEFIGGKGAPTKDSMEDYIQSLVGGDSLYDSLEDLLSRADDYVAPNFIKNTKQDDLLKKGYEDKLRKGAAKSSVEAYAKTREEILRTSAVLHDGFDSNAAEALITTLEKTHYFDAGHALVLRDKTTGVDFPVVESVDALRKIVDDELAKIISDPAVKKACDGIEKALGSAQGIEELKDALCNDPDFASAAADVDGMKLGYLVYSVEMCRPLVEKYLNGRKEYEKTAAELLNKVKDERTRWDDAVKLFTHRFRMPFTPVVGNRAGVIVEDAEPVIEFQYAGQPVSIGALRENLSDGERKALYMLFVIFEVEKARKVQGPRLLVFDDVVDSFDYANKYAFIEYLREFANIPDVCILLLTHNYDFFRTVTSRLDGFGRGNCVVAERNEKREISFKPVEYLNQSPFHEWKTNIGCDEYRVAAIPMVRELVAIRKGKVDPDYRLLSNALHGRESNTIRFKDLDKCFRENWDCDALWDDERLVTDVIMASCSALAAREDRLGLHEKIVLSLGIRIIVEGQISRAYKACGLEAPDCSKMGKLVGQYKNDFADAYSQHANLLEQATLITPENIHINSFMYEPLIDIGSARFIELFSECKEWLDQELEQAGGL